MPSALDRALDFLVASQTHAGWVPIGMGLQIEETEDDPSLFATAMVGEAVAASTDARAQRVVQRAAAYLVEHVERPGVWRHWTKEHPQFRALPADADDTAWASGLLALAGRRQPGNAKIFLENRDDQGRFHTWFLVRRAHGRPSRDLTLIGMRRAAWPVHARMFWKATSAEPHDIDGVVNAHVLAYLGPGPHAAAPARYVESILRDGRESVCDKWYRSSFVLYAAIARGVAAGVAELAGAGALAQERVLAAAKPDGRIGAGPLETALSLRTLAELGGLDEAVVTAALAYLERTQSADGSWPAEPMYFGGPAHHPEVPCWGSSPLTTGLCAGALMRVDAAVTAVTAVPKP